jgi:hypothetical protein
MQRAAGAFDLFEDVGGACRPDEGFGVVVVTIDVISDGHDQFFQIAKHTEPQSVLSQVVDVTR